MDETLLLSSETKWNLVRRLRKGSSFISKAGRTETDAKTQLFGQPLRKICPDNYSLPKPVSVSCLMTLTAAQKCHQVSFHCYPFASKLMFCAIELLKLGQLVKTDVILL